MFGERLKEERKRLGVNQDVFASAAGVSRRAYVEWEAGRVPPTAEHLAALAAADVDVLYIVTGRRAGAIAPATTLKPDEAALLDNYRHSPKDQQDILKATSAAFAQQAGRGAMKKAG